MTNPLHVANGTSLTRTIDAAGLPGETSIWADPLHEGPVPAVDDAELLRIRAQAIAAGGLDEQAVAAELARWRERIDGVNAYDELVLWYEHDLFDQLNLAQILDRLSTRQPWPRTVSLVSIGSYPGREGFKGM